jgi:predicted Zn finger-like uncharacterized protein
MMRPPTEAAPNRRLGGGRGGSTERGTLGHDSPTRHRSKVPSPIAGSKKGSKRTVALSLPSFAPTTTLSGVGDGGVRSRAPRVGEHAPYSRWRCWGRAMATKAAESNCPNCGALYKVVRMESKSTAADREITCRSCGAPLRGREGDFILNYFLVEGRHVKKGRPR